jgi:CheY-like chemotaxis protein
MKLSELTRELLATATEIYLSVAWPGREREKDPGIGVGDDLFAGFSDESKTDGNRVAPRYVLRLGNLRYPHMKFVVEEYLLPGEYVIAVDTHDELELKPDYPDYEAWQELKAKNREIKVRIEERWRAADIPTYAKLKEMVERDRKAPAEPGRSGLILVVDDERDIADAVASVLIAEGYDVLLAHDGREAVDTALREQPDLVLMDFQMPVMDGVEAAVKIRAVRTKADCRILLATASLVDLTAVGEADGFLMKPFSKDVLVSFIHALLK